MTKTRQQLLREQWNLIKEQGLISQLGTTIASMANGPAQTNNPSKPVDPNIQKQMDNLQQQIRDLDNKIAPMLDKKRKLEDQMAKLKKQQGP